MGYDCEAAINFSIDDVESQGLDADKKAILAKVLDYLRANEVPLKNKYMSSSFFASLPIPSYIL